MWSTLANNSCLLLDPQLCHADTGATIVPWRQPGDWAINSSDRLHRTSFLRSEPDAYASSRFSIDRCRGRAHQGTGTLECARLRIRPLVLRSTAAVFAARGIERSYLFRTPEPMAALQYCSTATSCYTYKFHLT